MHGLVGLEPNGHKKDEQSALEKGHAGCMKRNYDSLTRLSQNTEQVAEMAKRCIPSQTDVIFVAIDALVRIYEDDLIATRCVTAMQYPDALAYVSRLSYILARQKMRMKQSSSMMTAAIWLSSTPHLYLSESSASWLRLWLPASRVTFHGHF